MKIDHAIVIVWDAAAKSATTYTTLPGEEALDEALKMLAIKTFALDVEGLLHKGEVVERPVYEVRIGFEIATKDFCVEHDCGDSSLVCEIVASAIESPGKPRSMEDYTRERSRAISERHLEWFRERCFRDGPEAFLASCNGVRVFASSLQGEERADFLRRFEEVYRAERAAPDAPGDAPSAELLALWVAGDDAAVNQHIEKKGGEG